MVGVFSSGLAVIEGSEGGLDVVLEGGNCLWRGVFRSSLEERAEKVSFNAERLKFLTLRLKSFDLLIYKGAIDSTSTTDSTILRKGF